VAVDTAKNVSVGAPSAIVLSRSRRDVRSRRDERESSDGMKQNWTFCASSQSVGAVAEAGTDSALGLLAVE
jgi:hypothetical protein